MEKLCPLRRAGHQTGLGLFCLLFKHLHVLVCIEMITLTLQVNVGNWMLEPFGLALFL